jgi:hypothetical protein
MDAGELLERLRTAKAILFIGLLLLIDTPVAVVVCGFQRWFYLATLLAYGAELALLLACGPAARAARARRFTAPPQDASVGEIRLFVAATLALGPLCLLCAWTWWKEGQPLWTAGAAVALLAVLGKLVLAWRRFTRAA